MRSIVIVLVSFLLVHAEKISDSLWIAQHGSLPTEEGWVVIINGSKDSVIAQELYQSINKGQILHSPILEFEYESSKERFKFPYFVKSDELYGLNTGFWISIALITEHKAVAEKMVNYLQTLHNTSYMRPVKMFNMPDIRVIAIGEYVGVIDEDNDTEVSFNFLDVDLDLLKKYMGISYYEENIGFLCFYPYSSSFDSKNITISGYTIGAVCYANISQRYQNTPLWEIPRLKTDAQCRD